MLVSHSRMVYSGELPAWIFSTSARLAENEGRRRRTGNSGGNSIIDGSDFLRIPKIVVVIE